MDLSELLRPVEQFNRSFAGLAGSPPVTYHDDAVRGSGSLEMAGQQVTGYTPLSPRTQENITFFADPQFDSYELPIGPPAATVSGSLQRNPKTRGSKSNAGKYAPVRCHPLLPKVSDDSNKDSVHTAPVTTTMPSPPKGPNLEELAPFAGLIVGDTLLELLKYHTFDQIHARINVGRKAGARVTKKLLWTRLQSAIDKKAQETGWPNEIIQARIDDAQLANGLITEEELVKVLEQRQNGKVKPRKKARPDRVVKTGGANDNVADLNAIVANQFAAAGDRLIRLAGRYSRAKIAEVMNQARGKNVIDVAKLMKRLRAAIIVAAARDERFVEDIEKDIAVRRSENGVKETDRMSKIQL